MNLESIRSENLDKEIAYLLGVYITDGCIYKRTDKWSTYYNFEMSSIDREFVENTLKCIKKIVPNCSSKVCEKDAIERRWPDGRISKCQKQYTCFAGFTKPSKFFLNQTGNKHHIPYLIWNSSLSIKKWFIAGVMDGDGWISKTERKDYLGFFQYRIGIGGVEEGWIWEFKKLLQEMGIKTLKEEIDIRPPRVKPIVKFGIKVSSFVENGLFFTIKRKQNRVKEYISRNVQRLDAANPTGLR